MGCVQHIELVLSLQMVSVVGPYCACLIGTHHQAPNPSPRNWQIRPLSSLMTTVKGTAPRSLRKISPCCKIGQRLEIYIQFKGAEKEFPMTSF